MSFWVIGCMNVDSDVVGELIMMEPSWRIRESSTSMWEWGKNNSGWVDPRGLASHTSQSYETGHVNSRDPWASSDDCYNWMIGRMIVQREGGSGWDWIDVDYSGMHLLLLLRLEERNYVVEDE